MDESVQSICSEGSDWSVGENGHKDGGVLDVPESAPVDHGQVDNLQHEGDDCVSHAEAVVEVEIVNCIDQ